ncbi:acyl-CoA thioesterase [Wenzhouxiangella sp. AB-CW3]|uniref:acyl-CoA thioesterase n=1 Tax=Wenzhouxiangella sp. AB-CW3 TaxID=2771012 RepID=UPI00168BB7DC|nr:thioesterase family protein [Wenzhouxiangella sp. AB-CW3]QOC23614.1 acyl-CoA thioesterase [Wenzhouxiangella sp. AB-CW3]
MSEFNIQIDVRWGDMDAFGHVGNAVYLRYFEEARARWMESVASHWQGDASGPVVANININYRRPLHWPAQFEVTLKPRSPGRSSIKLEHEIRMIDPSGSTVVHADATCTLVWIDKKSGEPVPLPTSIRGLAAEQH